MRPSRRGMAIVTTCALLLLPGSAVVSAQSAEDAPMVDDHADMAAPAMDAVSPDMPAMPTANTSSSMDPDPAMMSEHDSMPAGMMPETPPTP